MSRSAPRLLVALRPREAITAQVGAVIPDVSWRYVTEVEPSELTSVEVILLGSVERDLGGLRVDQFPKLAFVQRAYTGLDGIPFEEFPERVGVAGNVGGFGPFVAEHAVALALGAARALRTGDQMVAEGRLRPPPPATTLVGTTALILGYGAIGAEIARRLEGFGMRRVGLNRNGRMAPGVDAMYPADRLEEALSEADVVFDVRPLTRATRGSIGADQLARMRPGAIYVNVGRAGTVDEEALYQHVSTHPTFRVALDCWWNEDYVKGTLEQRFPWTRLPNFLGTPHSAGAVPGAEEYSLRTALENVRRFFAGETPRYLADRRDYVEPVADPGSTPEPPAGTTAASPAAARFR
ncbi:MAG: NAD(P)-dependent oxidoreductase [Thermoplasmata archaeon]